MRKYWIASGITALLFLLACNPVNSDPPNLKPSLSSYKTPKPLIAKCEETFFGANEDCVFSNHGPLDFTYGMNAQQIAGHIRSLAWTHDISDLHAWKNSRGGGSQVRDLENLDNIETTINWAEDLVVNYTYEGYDGVMVYEINEGKIAKIRWEKYRK